MVYDMVYYRIALLGTLSTILSFAFFVLFYSFKTILFHLFLFYATLLHSILFCSFFSIKNKHFILTRFPFPTNSSKRATANRKKRIETGRS